MKISYNWLKQFIKIDWNAEKTGELLTDLGLDIQLKLTCVATCYALPPHK